MTDQPEKLDLKSMDLAAEKQAELLRLFPEIRTEGGKIDFDRLKLALGETVDVGRERYGLNWPGKADCFKTIQAPSLGTLRPAPKESVNFDTTENLIIEGDNLEVLKLLQKSYLGKVKMIYIDPPYNTGNDFIYPDNFGENLQTYLEYTGQVDSEGRKFGTNTETDGRFHSKWLNMLYPRLYLARNLLQEDGIIFVSIESAELRNLLSLMDDIFGEDARVAILIWHSKKGGGGGVKTIISEHEYIVAYSRSAPEKAVAKQRVESEELDLVDEIGAYRKGRELNKWGASSARADRETMYHPIPGPNGIDVYPIRNDGTDGRWRVGKNTILKMVKDGNVSFERRADGTYIAYEKIRKTDPREIAFRSLLKDAGTVADGTSSLKNLFDEKSPFDFPKPTKLISTLMGIAGVEGGEIVLDFFAGSGTTGHAVMDRLTEDGDQARFLLVQLPEQTDKIDEKSEVVETIASKMGFSSIAEITKERLRKAAKKIEEQVASALDLETAANPDYGFRVFKLDQSNFMGWDAGASADAEALGKQLDLSIDHVRQGRNDDDLFYELLLKSGFPLTTPVEKLSLAGKTVFSIGGGVFLICLERELTTEAIKAMADMKPSRVVCLDDGFRGNDQLKTNAVLTFRDKGVAKFQTV